MELMDEENVDLEDLKPRERAMIYLGLGLAYRYDEFDCVTFNSADWGGNCLETQAVSLAGPLKILHTYTLSDISGGMKTVSSC